ncbi:TPA: hypothetical protein QEF96_001721 [Stenotrophomonas maltophilia]|uniref:hypothetical protein n=1 Tax=Stenotrophomonas maltophilia TaxID=40324 RepID=UPI00113120B5|nr:hypothetical protein [Stenotrophomonas maltophilia]MPS47253.1 hypothetical protein [Stenotrophomonas sp.]QPX94389.1 hypothetical protein HUZ96_16615 [Stenotrophomonas maltophilia]HDS1223029.1 hypothetical protein [Stenotrophomonas maltophilia]
MEVEISVDIAVCLAEKINASLQASHGLVERNLGGVPVECVFELVPANLSRLGMDKPVPVVEQLPEILVDV